MNYYYINTNTEDHKSGQGSPQKWLDCGYAFTSGDYEEFGVQALGRLNPGDILFMYVNDCGVMAVGEVLEHWNRKTYEGDERLVDKEYPEYRIPVKWYIQLCDNPIEKEDLKKIFGSGTGQWYPRRTLRLLNPEKAEQLLSDAYNLRGIAKGESRQYVVAIEYFNKAIELDPQSAPAYSNRGQAKARLEQYEEAIKDFDKAIEHNTPELALAYYKTRICEGTLKPTRRSFPRLPNRPKTCERSQRCGFGGRNFRETETD